MTEGLSVTEFFFTGKKKIILEISEDELDLLKAAMSYMKTNANDVGDALDIVIFESEVEKLEEKIYKLK